MRTEIIETARLFLRSFEKDDARFAISIWNDPEMGEHLLDEAMEEISAEYLREIEALAEDEECYYLISEEKVTHERIGTCSFIVSDDGKTYDIAYCVHKSRWRNGFATEMVQGMIGHAKRKGADRITVRVNQDNIASNKVVSKFGFQIEQEHFHKKRGTEQEVAVNYYELKLK